MGNKPMKQQLTASKNRISNRRSEDSNEYANVSNYEATSFSTNSDYGTYERLCLAVGGQYEEIRHMRIRQDLFMVALDIGTSSSGYAISSYHSYKRDPLQISTFSWKSKTDGSQHFKTLSAVLLNPSGELHSIGYDAEYHYINSLQEDERQQWFYFQNFKMILYNHQISRDLTLHDVKGKPQKALKIFAFIIKGLKDDFTTRLAEQITFGESIVDEEIHWVITVPAIWDEKAKQFMREAARQAGIMKEKLSIALEPEVAALYCAFFLVEKLTGCSQDEETSQLKTFSPGEQYLIVDLGGGTVDITAYEILPGGGLREVIAASGGNWGSLVINDEFINLLEDLTETDIMKVIKESHPDDFLLFMSVFENKKRVFSKNDDRVILHVPQSIRDILSEKLGKSVEDHIEEIGRAHEVKFQRDKMYIYNEAFTKLLNGTIEKIILHVSAIIDSNKLKVDSIVLVGGFAEYDLLKSLFRASFPDSRILVPEDPVLAVLKGAVLCSRNPQILQTRVCRYTYGIRTTVDFDEKCFPPEKKVRIGGKMLAKDIFSIHIKANETIYIGQKGRPKNYYLSRDDQDQLNLKIYASTKTNPMLTTEDGVFYLGILEIKIPKIAGVYKESRYFSVSFLLDGTEMEVQAVDSATNETSIVKFDFIK